MTAGLPGVLADPVGVIVTLVAGVEPALSRAAVEAWTTAADAMRSGADHTEIARWLAGAKD